MHTGYLSQCFRHGSDKIDVSLTQKSWTAAERPALPCALAHLSERGARLKVADKVAIHDKSSAPLTVEDNIFLATRNIEIVSYLKANAVVNRPPLTSTDATAVLSFNQEACWKTFEEHDSQFLANQFQCVIPFTGISSNGVVGALRQLAARQKALCYSFTCVGGHLTAIANDPQELPFEIERVDERRLSTSIVEFVSTIIPTTARWLASAKIFETGPHAGIVVLLVHHLVGDLSSTFIVRKELTALIASAAANSESALPPLRRQFTDFAAWERRWFDSTTATELGNYWNRWLHNIPGLTIPESDSPLVWKPGRRVYYDLELPDCVGAAVRTASVACRQTGFVIFLAVFAISLAAWTQQGHFAILSVADARTFLDTASLAGTVGMMQHMDPIEVTLQSGSLFQSVVKCLAVTQDAARRLRFPLNGCEPGLRESDFHHKIAVKINYSYGRGPRTPHSTAAIERDSLSGVRSRIVRILDDQIAVPISPVHLRIFHVGFKASCRVEFNESLIPPASQEDFLSCFVHTLEMLCRSYGSESYCTGST